ALEGPTQKLVSAPLADAAYVDTAAPEGRKCYQVRALAPVTTGSGSFTNLSQGIFAEVRH
ncbi:MAG: hypothetical protein H7A47_17875, partial [Verrucomicrobiales bacterium]|nr:hypothetical protein [Verrucomicrobiales bacterium]